MLGIDIFDQPIRGDDKYEYERALTFARWWLLGGVQMKVIILPIAALMKDIYYQKIRSFEDDCVLPHNS